MEYAAGLLQLFDAVPQTDVDKYYNLRDVDSPTNAEITSEDSGSVFDEQLSLTRMECVSNGTVSALNSLFTQVDPSRGYACIGADLDITHASIIWRALEKCLGTDIATAHLRHRVDSGILRLNTLTAERGQDATLSWIIDAFSIDGNDPIAITPAIPWPTTPQESGRYELGACTIGSASGGQVFLLDLESLSIDWNVTLTEKLTDFGSIYTEAVGVNEIKPMITLRLHDLSQVQDNIFPLGATPIDKISCEMQLIKRQNDGEFEANDSSNHINIQATGVLAPTSLGNGSGRSRATNELQIQCRYANEEALPVNKFPLKFTLDHDYNPFPTS